MSVLRDVALLLLSMNGFDEMIGIKTLSRHHPVRAEEARQRCLEALARGLSPGECTSRRRVAPPQHERI